MRKYFYIGIFGFLGAVARFALKNLELTGLWDQIPLMTLLINVSGCLLFSLIVTLAYETRRIRPEWRLGLTAGFLGAYTTFSSFCRETITLVQSSAFTSAALYVALSLALGLVAAWAGSYLAKAIVINMIRKLRRLYFSIIPIGDTKK